MAETKYIRPSWDEYFMEIMEAVAKRATCDRGRTGCVMVRDNQILVTGYVGSPKGFPHCDEVGHMMKDMVHEDGTISHHCVRTIHGEQNAIAQASKRGISLDGATLYCRMTPCRTCAMLLINCGIKKVVANNIYHQGAADVLQEGGIELVVLHNELEQYNQMTEAAK